MDQIAPHVTAICREQSYVCDLQTALLHAQPTKLMKRLIACIALCAIAACGGDSSTAPKFAFPAVAGVYSISGGFDDGETPFSGTITFTQASRDQPALDGFCAITVTTTTGPVNFSTIDAASVSETGAIGFNIGSASGDATWRFTGVLNGGAINGTHLLVGDGGSFPGTFAAIKQ